MRKEDQVAFDRLMDKARGLASAAGYDPRTDPMESVFGSILVELEQELEELRKKIEEDRRTGEAGYPIVEYEELRSGSAN